jgi:hypothetical protein
MVQHYNTKGTRNMITIENQNAIATFSPVKGHAWVGKMYLKDLDRTIDLGYAREKHLADWNRIFASEQLKAHPILKEWGC